MEEVVAEEVDDALAPEGFEVRAVLVNMADPLRVESRVRALLVLSIGPCRNSYVSIGAVEIGLGPPKGTAMAHAETGIPAPRGGVRG